MNNLNNSPAKNLFWKHDSAIVPGSSVTSSSIRNVSRQSSQNTSHHKLTFKEFENHTEDAWDAADDDLLRTALAKIDMGCSSDQVHATAQAVIDHHSRTQLTPPKDKVESFTNANDTLHTDSKIASVMTEPSSMLSLKSTKSVAKRFPGSAFRTSSESCPDDNNHYYSPDSQITKKYNNTSATTNTSGQSENVKVFLEKPPNENGDTEQELTNDADIIPQLPDADKAGSAPRSQTIRIPMQSSNYHKENYRIEKFKQLINSDSTDLEKLKELSWPGIPSPVRAMTWQLLSGYLPASKDRRESVLSRKRNEYFNFVNEYYEARDQPMYQPTFHQIHIDIPRTNPLIPLFQQPTVQNIFERLLFVWAIRHPASGYVQGINDLVTPFFVVFLTAQIDEDSDVETYDVSTLAEPLLKNMEADTFWCTSNLLDGIQDNYTFAQPGVQTKVNKLKELTKRVDAELHAHLEAEGLEYLQFSFRWMNNLLMREIPLRCTIRLWDTYLAENDGFSDFHLYTCAAFLKQWRAQLLSEKDFQGLMLMIQNVPTHHWGEEEIKLLLAEAFRLKYTFADAPSHLSRKR